MRLLKYFLFPLILIFVSVSAVFAQTATGEVNGTVTDPNGAAVPGAALKLINQATKTESETSTSQSGSFTFVNVKPATYVLVVEIKGFKKSLTNAFTLGVSETVTQNLALAVGEMSEVVEVSAGSELVQSSSSELGTVINERSVEELPLNGRNFTQLLTLTPGVTPVSTSQNKSIGGVEGNVGIPGSGFVDPSFHGQQNRSKLYFFDGIINTNVRGPTYIVIPNIAAFASWPTTLNSCTASEMRKTISPKVVRQRIDPTGGSSESIIAFAIAITCFSVSPSKSSPFSIRSESKAQPPAAAKEGIMGAAGRTRSVPNLFSTSAQAMQVGRVSTQASRINMNRGWTR